MNDIDNWLNSLGIGGDTETINVPASSDTAPILADTVQQPQEEAVETNNQSFSLEDFNGILADNGFQEPVFDEAEEVNDGNEDEENRGEEIENTEEDYLYMQQEGYTTAEWTAMSVEERRQAVEEAIQRDHDAVHFHMPNGDVIDVPIIQEGTQTEEVSVDAMEEYEIATADVPEPPAPEPEPLIAPNSPTLLLNDSTSRFSGTEWYNEIQRSRIILAGCGGIGSWTILQLARMNPAALFMYDDDVVEIANMSGQLYCQEDVGKAKVDAMADMIRSYTTMRNIYAIKNKFTQNSEAGDIMICGFDNMAARKVFFNKWLDHLRDVLPEQKAKCVYLDGRLSIDTLQVFCITGDNDWAISEYADKYLFDDSEADATQCSLKQTTYLACMIGSVIVNLFTNFTANLLNPLIPYDLPFFTEYDAQNMIFKTIK